MPGVFALLTDLARQVVVQWYAQGTVSYGNAAELAGLTRSKFLEALDRRRGPARQVTAEKLAGEIYERLRDEHKRAEDHRRRHAARSKGAGTGRRDPAGEP
jgi:predicted HTH domain antitoxin